MSVEIATVVIGAISAFASVLRAWSMARERKRKFTPKQVDRAARPRKSFLTSKQIESLSNIIPEAIFKAILKNISEAMERFIAAIKDPSCNEQCQDREHKIAASKICKQLKRMKQLNNNQLPRKLENLWISFQCK